MTEFATQVNASAFECPQHYCLHCIPDNGRAVLSTPP
jgi:hypothetical protein